MARLPGVYINIQDGGLGLLPATSEGLQAKVGVCSAGEINQVVALSDPAQAVSNFGTGPLVNALLDAFAAGAGVIYAVRANGDIAGSVGAVTKTGTGSGSMTAAGTPLDAYEAIVEILTTGRLNTATFRYSLDGGDNWSGAITVPQAGAYAIPGTGVTITFTEGTPPENSFVAGDRYAFTVTAPTASVASVNDAIDALLASSYLYEFIHVVGPSDNAMWAALDVRAAEAEADCRYIHFLAEARGPNAGETVDQWVAALLAMRESFASTRVSVVAGRFELIDQATGRSMDRNGAGLYSGRLSKIKTHVSPGRYIDGPMPGVVGLRPNGINEAHILSLDQAGFITFRQYKGSNGFYITNGRMMAEQTSDFRYVELRRVMDEACTLVYLAALQSVQAEGTPAGLDALEARMTSPLQVMVGAGKITRGRVVIPRDQNILAGAVLRAIVKIVPIAIMREIEISIGFENPFLTKTEPFA